MMHFTVLLEKQFLLKRIIIIGCIGVLGLLVGCLPTPTPTEPPPPPTPTPLGAIVVTVREKTQPTTLIRNAVVRLASSSGESVALNKDDNTYRLQSCPTGDKITVWAPGHYIAVQNCEEENGKLEYIFDLARYTAGDEERSWSSSSECLPCHNGQVNESASRTHNEFGEWQNDGHSTVMWDGFLRDLYKGNYGLSDPFAAMGYRADYPNNYGNCGYCHAPGAVVDAEQEVDMLPLFNTYQGSKTEGINCDVCHKVSGVELDRQGLPFQDRPGILSYKLLQPEPQNTRMYLGSYTNPNLGEGAHTVSCAPIFSQSEFCAPCHYAKFWDVEIYASYKEWKESAYAEPSLDGYRTCQDCHMTPGGMDPEYKSSKDDLCRGSIDGTWPSTHNMIGRDSENTPAMIKALSLNLWHVS